MKRRVISILLAMTLATAAFTYNLKNCIYIVKADNETITSSQKLLGDFLGQCPKSFFDSVPVDEAFILWFEKNYGTEALSNIVKATSDGNFSSQLWYDNSGKSIHVLWTEYGKHLGIKTDAVEKIIRKDGKSDIVKLDFIGDINFDNNWGTMVTASEKENGIKDCISETVQKELKNADITVVNNEFVYNKNGLALEGKDYTFSAPESSVSNLNIFGANLVNLANNHVYDYGAEGLSDTLITLKNNDYEYIGAGKNLEEASQIKYYIINGRKIAIVSATQIEKYSDFTKAATNEEAGVLKIDDTDYVSKLITKANINSDYVIVVVHWGTEGSVNYDEEQHMLAEKFVNAGADAIIGGHPHRLQGASYIDDAPVFYSIGNFWFSDSKLYTTIVQINIDGQGEFSARMIPCLTEDCITDIITQEDIYADFYKYVSDVSTGIGFDQFGNIYNKAAGITTDKDGNEFVYSSEISYRRHAGGFDLIGRKIDIIGNLN